VNKYSRNQLDHVRAFVATSKPAWATWGPAEYENARLQWFHNPLNRDSLRLSHDGFKIVTNDCDLEIYSFELPEKIKPKTLLQLERHIKCPYYIRHLRMLKLTGEEQAIMLSLHANDLQQWLDQLDELNNSSV
jgi:hypothetical protein